MIILGKWENPAGEQRAAEDHHQAGAAAGAGEGRKLSDKLIKYEYLTSRLTLLTEVKRKHSQQKLDVRNILCKILKNLMSCYLITEAPETETETSF